MMKRDVVERVAGEAGITKHAAEAAVGGVFPCNDQDGMIPIRSAAASLAFSRCKYYQQAGLDEPGAVQRWRELCSDPDEFSEVKHSWLFAGD